MTRYGAQFGPDVTFLGVPRCDLDDPASYAEAEVVILGAPFDGGTSHRPGTRFGPQAIRMTDYLPHDGSRPSLALRTDGLARPQGGRCRRRRDVLGRHRDRAAALEAAVQKVTESGAIPVILGGDHSVTFPDAKGVANVLGHGRISMIHFDAHADTGDIEFGSLWGHGQPMRRLIESGALRGDRFLQVGLRGYWPGPGDAGLDGQQQMRSYEMTEIVTRGLDDLPDRGVRASRPTTATASSCRSTSTCATPVTRPAPAPPSPAACPRASCSTRSAGSASSCRWSGSTWSRSARRTTTPTSRPHSAIALCWRHFRRSPASGQTSGTGPPGTRPARCSTADRPLEHRPSGPEGQSSAPSLRTVLAGQRVDRASGPGGRLDRSGAMTVGISPESGSPKWATEPSAGTSSSSPASPFGSVSPRKYDGRDERVDEHQHHADEQRADADDEDTAHRAEAGLAVVRGRSTCGRRRRTRRAAAGRRASGNDALHQDVARLGPHGLAVEPRRRRSR